MAGFVPICCTAYCFLAYSEERLNLPLSAVEYDHAPERFSEWGGR